MGIAISEDHLELAGVADAFLERSGARAEARALLDAPEESLPASWKEIADLGWLGLHLPEEHGGSGFGLAELVVVVEELGAAIAPGPFVPTVLASAVIAARRDASAQQAALLPGLADGSVPRRGRPRRHGDGLRARRRPGRPVPAPRRRRRRRRDDRDERHRHRARQPRPHPPRRTGDVRRRSRATTACSPAPAHRGRARPRARGGRGHRRRAACVHHGRRVRQGARAVRPRRSRTFQAVKHHCANMLVAAELGDRRRRGTRRAPIATTRDSSSCAAAVAAALGARPRVRDVARLNIQVHGGIGFTWEHDAHLYLRRAIDAAPRCSAAERRPRPTSPTSTAAACAGAARGRPAARGRGAPRRGARVRRAVRESRRRRSSAARSIDSGYAMPHWPKPWGRDAERGRAAGDRARSSRRRRQAARSTASPAGSS